MVIRTEIFLAALVLDITVGDPTWLPHPVQAIGAAIAGGDALARDTGIREHAILGRIAGIVTTVAVVGGSYILATALLRRAGKARSALEVMLAASTLAWRSLIAEVLVVEAALAANDIALARRRLARIVGRDTERLDASEIARAAIETLAESLCDGIVAPLCYLVLGGAPLALAYKAVNTLDSTIGHIEPPYCAFGWFAARVDDAANFIPARISALLVAAAAQIFCGNASRSLQIARRDARLHRSPNAGWPEAAIAGAMRVRLGGSNAYGGVAYNGPTLGAEFRSPNPHDIGRARQLVSVAAALLAVAASVVLGARDALA
ncbi:MAG: adenosylcobinamide-phosphate synthase CbiB [Candidatus Baltobacteraceae bacterium]